jgi:tripartite-type tricarboxylate transporter receptor subunit TctC
MRELPYDQLKDFVPVASVGNSTWFLVVPKSSPFKSVKDVVDYARSNPDQVTGGFWQSSVLVTTIAFGKAAGIQIRRVPYKGAVESVTDVIADRLSLLFVDYNSIRGHAEAGSVRVLASTSSQRSNLFGGNIPTLTELGYPVVTDTMTVIFAPTGTAKPIIERINTEMVKIVNSSTAQARIEQIGLDPVAMSLTELDNFVRSELPRWGRLIEASGLQKQ